MLHGIDLDVLQVIVDERDRAWSQDSAWEQVVAHLEYQFAIENDSWGYESERTL
jgi:hypothetical protein